MGWNKMETAPEGDTVDLWVEGSHEDVSFYVPEPVYTKDGWYAGRVTDCYFYEGHWRISSGLTRGTPVDTAVEVVAWHEIPRPFVDGGFGPRDCE